MYAYTLMYSIYVFTDIRIRTRYDRDLRTPHTRARTSDPFSKPPGPVKRFFGTFSDPRLVKTTSRVFRTDGISLSANDFPFAPLAIDTMIHDRVRRLTFTFIRIYNDGRRANTNIHACTLQSDRAGIRIWDSNAFKTRWRICGQAKRAGAYRAQTLFSFTFILAFCPG